MACRGTGRRVGGAIDHIGNVQKKLPKDERPEKTLFIITTDGMENASVRYSYDKVKKMVEKKKQKKHWEFIFLGANIDAVEVAGRFGVAANRAVRYECEESWRDEEGNGNYHYTYCLLLWLAPCLGNV